MRVVLDANQFVSGVLVPRGNPARILDAWRAGRFELLLSDGVLGEIRRVLQYPKIRRRLGWSAAEIEGFVERLRDSSTVVEVRSRIEAVADDPDDDAYVALAADGGADFLVSGDRHLLGLGSYGGVRILSAAEFLAELARSGDSA